MKTIGTMLAYSLLLGSAVADEKVAVRHGKTAEGIEYGLWGAPRDKPAPILIALSGTIDTTLGKPYFRQCGNELAEHGYLCLSVDLPCHGKRTTAGQPSGLGGWSFRAAKGEDFIAEFNARLAKVLDHLIKTGVADPQEIAACGTSRGGFLAMQFAAHDERVKCVAAFAPVTDLAALSEFRGIAKEPIVEKLSLSSRAAALAGRPVWIVIGDRDDRVGTDKAIAFARRLSAVSREKGVSSRVELQVRSEPRGHTTPPGSSARAAEWILKEMAEVQKESR